MDVPALCIHSCVPLDKKVDNNFNYGTKYRMAVQNHTNKNT